MFGSLSLCVLCVDNIVSWRVRGHCSAGMEGWMRKTCSDFPGYLVIASIRYYMIGVVDIIVYSDMYCAERALTTHLH